MNHSFPEGCVIWPGAKDRGGYGYLRSGLLTAKAHRFAYELFVGAIPKGMHVLHSCDERSCVNPRHLRVGTHAENVAEMYAKGRNAKGSDFRNAKLNDEAVREIRSSECTLRELANRFGVAVSIVHRVKQNKSWRHVK